MLGCRQAMIDEFDLDMDHEISEQEFIKCVDFSCELLWKVGADEVGAASWRMMCEGVDLRTVYARVWRGCWRRL